MKQSKKDSRIVTDKLLVLSGDTFTALGVVGDTPEQWKKLWLIVGALAKNAQAIFDLVHHRIAELQKEDDTE